MSTCPEERSTGMLSEGIDYLGLASKIVLQGLYLIKKIQSVRNVRLVDIADVCSVHRGRPSDVRFDQQADELCLNCRVISMQIKHLPLSPPNLW